MEKNYLFPSKYGKIAWVMLCAGVCLMVLTYYDVIPALSVPMFSIIPDETAAGMKSFIITNDINDEIGTLMIMVSLFLIAFSAEKEEDEYTNALRMRSWFLAGITYCTVYVLCDLLVYGMFYLYYMWFVQGGMLLLLYIVIFKTKLYLLKRKCDGQ